jgi:ribosomal protein S27E
MTDEPKEGEEFGECLTFRENGKHITRVECPDCNEWFTFEHPTDHIRYANVQDCELCGSHYDYMADIICPHCDKEHEIIVGEM